MNAESSDHYNKNLLECSMADTLDNEWMETLHVFADIKPRNLIITQLKYKMSPNIGEVNTAPGILLCHINSHCGYLNLKSEKNI